MSPELLPLLCLGLCAGQSDRTVHEPPSPFFSALPRFLVPAVSNVTLRCWTHIRNVEFTFTKESHVLPSETMMSLDDSGRTVVLPLTNLSREDAGNYSCKYCKKDDPSRCSPASYLSLVVGGNLSKPFFSGQMRRAVSPGANVTLECVKGRHTAAPVKFVLLKEGTPEFVESHTSTGAVAQFHLGPVKAMDSGNYSCVYYQTEAPFSASLPSASLEIQVTGVASSSAEANLILLGLAAVFLVLLEPSLVEA
ncbi:T-cell-interacting, activating receptor on myeloid cells protein 1-like [Tupaia chinensis]|uniref:T-cell-interacting, activating receptor on myeloid cells protein 1-like n=1 Tax=Tupaia chinensis TaxID=246437 RepID=UPI000FFB3D39|nr:T-cell-interacting, activating receptor on myeloid cells protein 1-like [Tupaia chinensis]